LDCVGKDEAEFDFPTEIVNEGEVNVLVPKLKAFVNAPWEYAPSKAPVFYNPIMEVNRDFAVLALQAYQKLSGKNELSVCESLAGCGIRGIRFAKEVKGVTNIVLNDISSKAVKLMNFNLKLNGLENIFQVFNEEANLCLRRFSMPRKRFDYVDVDPFGSPTPYLESALKALRNGGMLGLTATDMATLCGVYPKVCIRNYGGKPLRTEYCHELAVRLLAGCVAVTAARHEVGVDFVFCHSTNHYIRLYTIIQHGARKADESIQKLGYILHCFNCLHREAVRGLFPFFEISCRACGSKLVVAGPLWLGKIFDFEFCGLMSRELANRDFRLKRFIDKTLNLVKSEVDAPLTYYVVDKISDKLGMPVPSVKRVIERLKEKGFVAVRTHFNMRGIRTDAPAGVVVETVRELVLCG